MTSTEPCTVADGSVGVILPDACGRARTTLMRMVECVAVVVTLACVFGTGLQEMWCWPLGILGAILYGFVFHHARLYSDVLLQVFFVGMSIHGWLTWAFGGEGGGELTTGVLSWVQRGFVFSAAIAGTWLLGRTMKHRTRAALPYFDAYTTVVSVLAQILLNYKFVESWLLWMAVNVVASLVYARRRLWPTTVLYLILLANATNWFFQWLWECWTLRP